MVLLKANAEMKTVFQKMINTMGVNVKWTEIFVINNNDIILAGEGRSLFFNFDNRRAFSNILELPIKEGRVEQINQNPLLENTLNMILYAFGKWGEIKGLTVETNYDQLNRLLNNILSEIDVESNLTSDKFRFYKDGVQVTYEEVIQLILDKSKPQMEEDSDEDLGENNNEDKDDESKEERSNEEEHGLGLWHNIRWNSGRFSFEKEELTESDSLKSRLGNNFYIINYRCPDCGEKLYMVVYPVGKEFRIETEKEAVYMSRAYTCSACNHFYTPKPHKLLIEGDVYHLTFEDDRVAYKDYLELLGRQGERTSNSNFNLFESEYNGKTKEIPQELEKIYSDIDSMSEKEILVLKDRMDSGFYPLISVEKYYKKVDKKLKSQEQKKDKNKNNEDSKDKENKNKKSNKDKENNANKENKTNTENNKNDKSKVRKKGPIKNQVPSKVRIKSSDKKYILASMKKTEELHIKKINHDKSEKETNIKSETIYHNGKEAFNKVSPNKEIQIQGVTKSHQSKIDSSTKAFDGLKDILEAILRGEHDSFNSKVEKLTSKQLGNLKSMIKSEQGLVEKEKQNYIEKIERFLHKVKEKELNQKVESSKEKSYAEIQRVIEEIKSEDYLESVKTPFLESLMEYLLRNGEKELKNLILHIPENISKKQHIQFKDKIEQYKEIDTERYKKILDEKRDTSEKQEITAFIKRANAKDRNTLFDLYHKLKEQDFEERNVSSFLENIYDKISSIDEAAIKRICPDPADITFDEGLKMYEEISSENFLPDLKTNVLGLIDKRLKKLKLDECEQLVKKLSKDMNWTKEDYSRIHFYDVRKIMKGYLNDEESIIVHNALNTYAVNRGKYEYPILICDTSYSANGKSGFVLTPDHIFYNSLFGSGVMDVMNIEKVLSGDRYLRKGIYVNHKNAGKKKISNSLKSNKLKFFAKALNDFISYLKEKPESRNISYLAKEKHTVKCCYRCGFVYEGGNVCPKCGSKNNE